MDKDFLTVRLQDLSRQAYATGSYRFSDFVSANDALQALDKIQKNNYTIWGPV